MLKTAALVLPLSLAAVSVCHAAEETLLSVSEIVSGEVYDASRVNLNELIPKLTDKYGPVTVSYEIKKIDTVLDGEVFSVDDLIDAAVGKPSTPKINFDDNLNSIKETEEVLRSDKNDFDGKKVTIGGVEGYKFERKITPAIFCGEDPKCLSELKTGRVKLPESKPPKSIMCAGVEIKDPGLIKSIRGNIEGHVISSIEEERARRKRETIINPNIKDLALPDNSIASKIKEGFNLRDDTNFGFQGHQNEPVNDIERERATVSKSGKVETTTLGIRFSY